MTDPADLGLLTEDEQLAINQAGALWKILRKITANRSTRTNDLNELAFHIHAIQRAVMAQAAARAYPNEYRLLGDVLPEVSTPL